MIVVDTSVWVDYFNGVDTPASGRLDALLVTEPLAIGDLILAEVLQGFRRDRDRRLAREVLTSLIVVDMVGRELAIRAANNHRLLRKRGVTVRRTIDVLIATCCIARGFSLLWSNRDFDPCRDHLGLRDALHDA